MILENERCLGLGTDVLSAYALGTRALLWFGHACCGERMLLEHERKDDFGMDVLVTVCGVGAEEA